MDDRLELLREISEIPGVSGFEGEVRKYIAGKMQGISQVTTDNLGSVICRKTGSSESPKIMMAGHMDEIGMMVTLITKEGFLKFQTLGGWWTQVMLAQRVNVMTRDGPVLGIVGSKPPHILPPDERGKPVETFDMFIDVGASSREDAESMGITPGDPVVPVSPFAEMKNPKYLLGKAWDNRLGCLLFMEVIKNLQGVSHPNTVFGVATVQEEVGLRGAITSVHTVNPDIGFALEVDIPGDTPGVKEHQAQAKLGKGPSIVLYDRSMIGHKGLRDFVLDTAKAAGIPVQFNAMPGGGTDAGAMHTNRSGVPSLVVGVPTRYIHSHAGVVHRDDIDAAITLMTEVCRKLDDSAAVAIKGT